MLDRALIGTPLTDHAMVVERGRVRAFAAAIGETNPVYFDVAVARSAGYPDLPVPPTFLNGLDMMTAPYMFEMAGVFGLDIRTILHAEQSFTYHAMAFAGDRLTFTGRICDIYTRRDGTLEFAVSVSEVRRDGLLVVEVSSTIVVASA
jgi:hypothetical protein